MCRNCKKSVASAHFTLHEVHCLRFVVLCPECEEPVPQAKMKEHLQDAHQQRDRLVPSSCLLPKECQESPVKCKFCELAMDLSKLDIHETHCGSQLKHCPYCNQPVMLRKLSQHKDECQSEQAWLKEGKRTSPSEKKIHCDYCQQMIPENKCVHHMEKCAASKSTKRHPAGKSEISPPSSPSQAAGNQTSTVEKDVRPKTKNINRFLLSESSAKQGPRDQNDTWNLPLTSGLKPRTAQPTGDEAAYNILRRCPRCGILLPLPTLSCHQEKCLRLASLKGKQ